MTVSERMQLTVLGTSAMVPTKDRNHSAYLLTHKTEGLIMDCGEGTQRQLKLAGIPPSKITRIMLSHWHGDHTLGLPGLLMTMSQSGYSETLQIYGPKGTKQHLKSMFEAFEFDMRMRIEVHEVGKDTLFETEELIVTSLPLEHGIPCIGFRIEEKDRRRINLAKTKKMGIPEGPLLGKLQRGEEIIWKGKPVHPKDTTELIKGKIVALVTDTSPCKNAHILAENADLLICEASYTSTLEEKAEEYTHMTARQAGQLASQAGVKKLCITHFSARYITTNELLEDARTAFQETVAAHDLMKIALDKV
jgi:ribonuclease Z